MADGGGAAGAFDSLADRLAALAAAVGAAAAAPAPEAAPAPADWGAGRPVCTVCMDAEVAAAMAPCFHAAFCAGCAAAAVAAGNGCPVCRRAVSKVQRIYLP
jgi:hypothetical protein